MYKRCDKIKKQTSVSRKQYVSIILDIGADYGNDMETLCNAIWLGDRFSSAQDCHTYTEELAYVVTVLSCKYYGEECYCNLSDATDILDTTGGYLQKLEREVFFAFNSACAPNHILEERSLEYVLEERSLKYEMGGSSKFNPHVCEG